MCVLPQAVEETLDKVVRLLAYIADKDLFVEFYRKKLSRRLLFDKCANEEHERVILQALKQQFPDPNRLELLLTACQVEQ